MRALVEFTHGATKPKHTPAIFLQLSRWIRIDTETAIQVGAAAQQDHRAIHLLLVVGSRAEPWELFRSQLDHDRPAAPAPASSRTGPSCPRPQPICALRTDAPDRTVQITMRVKRSVLAYFKALGRGYQTRMNRVLESYVRHMTGNPDDTGRRGHRSRNPAQLRRTSHAATMAHYRAVNHSATWSLSMSPPT